MDPETDMLQFSQKKDDDIKPHCKSQFCLLSMDKMVCFQDCETGFDDDEFVDLEDGPQVAQHWFENCNVIEKEKDVSKDWSDSFHSSLVIPPMRILTMKNQNQFLFLL